MTEQSTIFLLKIHTPTISKEDLRRLVESLPPSSKKTKRTVTLFSPQISKEGTGRLIVLDSIILFTEQDLGSGFVHVRTMLSISPSHVNTSSGVFYTSMDGLMTWDLGSQGDWQ